MPPPRTRRVPGTGSIPSGFTLGRSSLGFGDVELLAASTQPAAAGVGSSVATITLTQPAAGLTITGGPANFTFSLANDLAGLEGLGSTGFAVRTATDTWAQRSIAGTASRLSVSNGDGVAGNPTLDIDAAYVGQASITTLGTITTGTWTATKIGLTYGGTNADLSATGGTSNVLQQTSAGAAITVGQLAASNLSNGTTGSGAVVLATSPTIAGGSITALTTFALRDTSAAFDVTIAATSAPVLSAGRTLTIDMSNVAHTLDLGATANTITFPNDASPQLAAFDVAQTWTATQTSMTLATATLTGTTTLTDSGQITSSGELGLGTSPTGRLHLGGTYTTANSALARIAGTMASSGTSQQTALTLSPTFAPTGASLTTVVALSSFPAIDSNAFTITTYNGIYAGLTLGASFSGTLTNARIFYAENPTISGGSLTNLDGMLVGAFTNGNGITSGTVTNRGMRVNAFTSAAGAGGTIVNEAVSIALGSGSSAGTTNYGLRITGNGGAASTNYAINSSSTAISEFAGDIRITTAGTNTASAVTVGGTQTLTSKTISSGSLTGTTTLTDSGSLTSAGELGMGGTPAARLSAGGTYTTANSTMMRVTGTLASSVTSSQAGLNTNLTFAPSGASLTTIWGALISPTLNSTAFTLTAIEGVYSGFTLGASFSGVVTDMLLFHAASPTISGGEISTLTGLSVDGFSNGNGITSGSRTNRGVRINAFTAAAGAGGTITNESASIAMPTASSAGTTNYGIRITGNGGAASTNWAINSSSTAASRLDGPLTVMGATAIPAGGTTGSGVKVSSTANFGVFFGSGAPTLTAAKGSLYLRSDGSGTTNRAYINTDSGTTWTALTTAA